MISVTMFYMDGEIKGALLGDTGTKSPLFFAKDEAGRKSIQAFKQSLTLAKEADTFCIHVFSDLAQVVVPGHQAEEILVTLGMIESIFDGRLKHQGGGNEVRDLDELIGGDS